MEQHRLAVMVGLLVAVAQVEVLLHLVLLVAQVFTLVVLRMALLIQAALVAAEY
jgi:hypothetical protein